MINIANAPTIGLLVFSIIIAHIPVSHCHSTSSRYCDSPYFGSNTTEEVVAEKYGLRSQRQDLERITFLRNYPIPVLLRVIYDSSLEAEFPEQHVRDNYIRNLVFGAQLIIEQPELREHIKLDLIVLSIEKLASEFPANFSASDMIRNVNQVNGGSKNTKADLTVMIFYKDLYDHKPNRIFGQAGLATFCNSDRGGTRGTIINAFTLNTALVLAHEFGHNLGMLHDDEKSPHECQENSIMSTISGRGQWSWCSVQMAKNHLVSEYAFHCLYNETRLSWAVPMNENFDFRRGSPKRRPYPGEQVSLDEQCQLATDKIARALPIQYHDACAQLTCELDGDLLPLTLPALYGSDCMWGDRRGKCQNQVCFVEPL